MENFQESVLTNNVESLAALNYFNQNYHCYGMEINMKAVAKDYELLLQFKNAYQSRHNDHRPSLGDCILLPDGQTVYFCHLYDSRGQTCQLGSFHLSNWGTISYSGGLDIGISYSDIELTTEKSLLTIWFSHNGYLTGGCAIHANIECRVWKTKVGADLDGIPQVKQLRRKKLKEQSETIEKIDGNNRKYAVHLPEVVIVKENLSEELFNEIKELTGLIFEDDVYFNPVYWCQPKSCILVPTNDYSTNRSAKTIRPIQ